MVFSLFVASLILTVLWCAYTLIDDIRRHVISNASLVLGGISAVVVAIAFTVANPSSAYLSSMAGGACALGALYLALRILAPTQLGGGDLRLAPCVGALGATAGTTGWILVFLGPFACTALWGIGQWLLGRGKIVAHGPGMSVCATAALFLAVLTHPSGALVLQM